MVIRGRPRGNGAQLADYLLNEADNDNVRVLEIRGTAQPNDLKASLIEMSLTSELTTSGKGLYHAQINPAYGEDQRMREEDWQQAASILETELKLEGQKRAIVLHEKNGRTHAHVVWERYDHAKGKMVSDSFSRLAQDRARKTMEQTFAHKQTPDRNVRRPEMKRALTELWGKTISGAEFVKESLLQGYIIARGELRRPFMVVDQQGRSFDLVRQLSGVRTREVRERLKREELKTEKQTIQEVRDWQKKQEQRQPEKIRIKYQLSPKADLPKKLDTPSKVKSEHQENENEPLESKVQEKTESQAQPGDWVKKYEEAQEQAIEAHREREKEKMVREMKQQLERMRERSRERER
jgi:hypothetical protein